VVFADGFFSEHNNLIWSKIINLYLFFINESKEFCVINRKKMEATDFITTEKSLDPENWEELRRLGHRMVDDMMYYLQTIRERPAWKMP
jgi:hypothetical protein